MSALTSLLEFWRCLKCIELVCVMTVLLLAVSPQLRASQCGNGIMEKPEQCDDGNNLEGDGCNAECRIEWGYTACPPTAKPDCGLVCGDGVRSIEEGCDDGNNDSGDGCSSTCEIETPVTFDCALLNDQKQKAAFPDYVSPRAYGGFAPNADRSPIADNFEPILEPVPYCNGLPAPSNDETIHLLEYKFLVVLDASWVEYYEREADLFATQGYPTLESSPELLFDRASYIYEQQFGIRLSIGRLEILPGLLEKCATTANLVETDVIDETNTFAALSAKGIDQLASEAGIIRLGVGSEDAYCLSYSNSPGFGTFRSFLTNQVKPFADSGGMLNYLASTTLAHEVGHFFGMVINRGDPHHQNFHVINEIPDIMVWNGIPIEEVRQEGMFFKFLTTCTPAYDKYLCAATKATATALGTPLSCNKNTGECSYGDWNEDRDQDGVPDSFDAFPDDPGETADSDGDGVGDNADEMPDNPNESLDTDRDNVGNNEDEDDDNDGVLDNDDAFPLDASESSDSDGDGAGDNAEIFERSRVSNFLFRSEILFASPGQDTVYSDIEVGQTFVGSINPSSGTGFLTNGAVRTDFICCSALNQREGFGGTRVLNDYTVSTGLAFVLNTVLGTSLADQSVIDVISLGGDTMTEDGGQLEIGVWIILDSETLDDQSHDNYPPEADNVLGQVLFILQRDPNGEPVSSAFGKVVIEASGMVGLPEVSDLEEDKFAVLVKYLDGGSGRTQIKQIDGSHVGGARYFKNYDAKGLLRIADLNGNGAPELGVLQSRRSDSRSLLELRDSSTNAVVNNVWFSRDFTARYAVALGDLNGNDQEEVAVLNVHNETGQAALQVRDSLTGSIIRDKTLLAQMWVMGLTTVPDANGNGSEELAALLLNKRNGQVVVQVVDPLTGDTLQKIFHPMGLSAQGIASMTDINGNNVPEIVTLVTRKSDGLVGARIYDLESGKAFQRMWYRADSSVVAPVAMAIFDDLSENGAPEVGVVVMRGSDGRQVIQLRDPLTKRAVSNVWLAPGFMPTTIAPLNVSDDVQRVGVLGYARNGKMQARIYNSASGRQDSVSYLISP